MDIQIERVPEKNTNKLLKYYHLIFNTISIGSYGFDMEYFLLVVV